MKNSFLQQIYRKNGEYISRQNKIETVITVFILYKGLSPKGKASDFDSVISGFESR